MSTALQCECLCVSEFSCEVISQQRCDRTQDTVSISRGCVTSTQSVVFNHIRQSLATYPLRTFLKLLNTRSRSSPCFHWFPTRVPQSWGTLTSFCLTTTTEYHLGCIKWLHGVHRARTCNPLSKYHRIVDTMTGHAQCISAIMSLYGRVYVYIRMSCVTGGLQLRINKRLSRILQSYLILLQTPSRTMASSTVNWVRVAGLTSVEWINQRRLAGNRSVADFIVQLSSPLTKLSL